MPLNVASKPPSANIFKFHTMSSKLIFTGSVICILDIFCTLSLVKLVKTKSGITIEPMDCICVQKFLVIKFPLRQTRYFFYLLYY